MLEYLYIEPPGRHRRGLILPQTFRAPRICHLILLNFAFPIGSPLLMTPMDLVTLSLQNIHPSGYFHPSALIRRLALMPLLETLRITFYSPLPSRDVQRQLLDTPITTYVTLPNLRWFGFGGISAYLEAILPWMTTPLLEKLQIMFSHQLTFSVPRLLQFMNTTENLRLRSATLAFYHWAVTMRVYPHEGARMYALYSHVTGRHLDWQVASAAQIFNALGAIFSTVEDLTLEYWRHSILLEWRDEADRMQWRDMLRPFSNLKTLHVGHELIEGLSRSLQVYDGESPMELLPGLKELSYTAAADDDAVDAFTAFINAHQNAGHPVTLVRL